MPVVGSDTQDLTSRIVAPPSAAACRSAARTRRAWASQNSRSPLAPPRPVLVVVAPSMSAARSAAVTGFAHPISGLNVTVDGSPASPTALNTYTGPLAARRGAVIS